MSMTFGENPWHLGEVNKGIHCLEIFDGEN